MRAAQGARPEVRPALSSLAYLRLGHCVWSRVAGAELCRPGEVHKHETAGWRPLRCEPPGSSLVFNSVHYAFFHLLSAPWLWDQQVALSSALWFWCTRVCVFVVHTCVVRVCGRHLCLWYTCVVHMCLVCTCACVCCTYVRLWCTRVCVSGPAGRWSTPTMSGAVLRCQLDQVMQGLR